MLYLESLPLWTRGLVSIPDYPPLIRELRLLERIPGRIGKDQVTHPRNCHDDLANVTCAALAMAASTTTMNVAAMKAVVAKLQMMGPYNSRRPLGERRPDMRIGERQAAMLQRSRGF